MMNFLFFGLNQYYIVIYINNNMKKVFILACLLFAFSGTYANTYNPVFMESARNLIERGILYYQTDPEKYGFDNPILRQE